MEDGMTRPRKKTKCQCQMLFLGAWDATLSTPRDRGILSWPWWIDCASPFLCTAQRSQGPKMQRSKDCRVENPERERDAEPCIASCLSVFHGRPSTVSACSAALAKPWPNRVRQPRANFTTPQQLGTAGGASNFADGPTTLHHIAEEGSPVESTNEWPRAQNQAPT
jgi:hypothetical protein